MRCGLVITHVVILHFVQCIIVYDDLLRYSLPVQSALLMFADNGSDSIVLSKSDRRFIQESADESVPNIYSLCVCVLMSFSSGIPPPLHLGVLQICGIFLVYLSVWQY